MGRSIVLFMTDGIKVTPTWKLAIVTAKPLIYVQITIQYGELQEYGYYTKKQTKKNHFRLIRQIQSGGCHELINKKRVSQSFKQKCLELWIMIHIGYNVILKI